MTIELSENTITSLSVEYKDTPQNDSIDISNEQVDGGSANVVYDPELKKLYVTVVPFIDIELQHTAANKGVEFKYNGVETRQIDNEEIAIMNGKANLANPFYGLVSFRYADDDCGELTIKESGEVTAAVPDSIGFCFVTYKTKRHVYSAKGNEKVIVKVFEAIKNA